ncbi:MAG: hypothetical protein QM723_18675 [Myxococcaceae bacterium]
MRFGALLSVILFASSDSFSGYAGVQLRAAPEKIEGFAKSWSEHPDKRTTQYTFNGTPPPFEGVKVDKALVQVSKKLHVVIGIGLSLSGDRCPQLIKALNAKWGEAFEVGGSNHELEWQGAKLDASIENAGPGACMFFIGDRGYDDTKDEWKPGR